MIVHCCTVNPIKHRMKLRIPPIAAATCFLLANFAVADIIFLKDGGKIEGTLVREDDDNYVMEVQVSGTIIR